MNSKLIAPSRARPVASLPQQQSDFDSGGLAADDSAYRAVTDFLRDGPITVGANYPIEAMLADVNRLGVHALLVTCEDPDDEGRVVGLISSYEIRQARAVRRDSLRVSQFSQQLRVGDVMTPCDDLAVVRYESLREMTAFDLYRMFQGTGLTHLLVVDAHDSETARARGLISRACLVKRLCLSRLNRRSGTPDC